MAVDLKAELTRPLALILTAVAALGWVMFALSSWSSAAAQKAQRLRILDLTEKRDAATSELTKQVQANGALADMQAKVASIQAELARVSQTRQDVTADLAIAQKNLSNTRRDLADADRTLQSQTQKVSDAKVDPDVTPTTADEGAPVVRSRSRGGRRYYRRGRRRSYTTLSRSR